MSSNRIDDLDDPTRQWDHLHESPRFRPAYPSEPVVRFISRHFGGIGAAPDRAAHLLDIGCGAGRHTVAMARAGHDVAGVDTSKVGLETARRRIRAEDLEADLLAASMSDLPFDDDSFDGAVSYGVFLYGDASRFRAAVDEAYRVLRPGGRLMCVTRSVDDDRFRLGEEIEPGTVFLASNETNEQGFLMHFLNDARVDEFFGDFNEVLVDRHTFTLGGGSTTNADLVIETVK